MKETKSVSKLKQFAVVSRFDDKIKYLADVLAEEECWYYDSPKLNNDDPRKEYAVLYQYLMHTFEYIYNNDLLKYNSEKTICIANTGLLTKNGEEIFFYFQKKFNKNSKIKWNFKTFYVGSDKVIPETLRKDLPEHINYFKISPDLLYFDPNLEIEYNVDHIINENSHRLPDNLKELDGSIIRAIIDGAVNRLKQQIKRNSRIVHPQYYNDKIMYLAPINLVGTVVVLGIERLDSMYRVNTILTLDMAYCNARLLNKPESNWLVINREQ